MPGGAGGNGFFFFFFFFFVVVVASAAAPLGSVGLCYSDTKGSHVALAPERHKDCTSCHNPHAPKPEDTRTSCSKCHSDELTQVMAMGPRGTPRTAASVVTSRTTTRCRLRTSAANATATRPRPWPPRAPEAPGLHVVPPEARVQDHGYRGDVHAVPPEPVRRGGPRPASIPHQADCKNCHTFHGEPGVAQTACLDCHKKVAGSSTRRTPSTATATSCHKSHTPASSAPAECRNCHQDKAAIAALWPPQSAHAQACTQCHQQHDVRNKKACSECHAPETASLASGPAKHQCQSCHPPHGAPPGQGPAWWQRCNACHQAKVQSVKERGPVHSDCKNCHKPHEFGAAGLHVVPHRHGEQGPARRGEARCRLHQVPRSRTSRPRRPGSSASPATRTGQPRAQPP